MISQSMPSQCYHVTLTHSVSVFEVFAAPQFISHRHTRSNANSASKINNNNIIRSVEVVAQPHPYMLQNTRAPEHNIANTCASGFGGVCLTAIGARVVGCGPHDQPFIVEFTRRKWNICVWPSLLYKLDKHSKCEQRLSRLKCLRQKEMWTINSCRTRLLFFSFYM